MYVVVTRAKRHPFPTYLINVRQELRYAAFQAVAVSGSRVAAFVWKRWPSSVEPCMIGAATIGSVGRMPLGLHWQVCRSICDSRCDGRGIIYTLDARSAVVVGDGSGVVMIAVRPGCWLAAVGLAPGFLTTWRHC